MHPLVLARLGFRASDFGFLSDFGLRFSDFGILQTLLVSTNSRA